MTPNYEADAKALLAAIVDSSDDAIISKDLNSIIRTWNAAAETLFGYSADEAVGRSILMLIPEHLWDEEHVIISKIKAGERIKTYETIRKRKDGTLVPISLTISPILSADGTIVGASKIARDISERIDRERRIQLLLREVNHRVKNQFAVILSLIRETGRTTRSPADFERRIRERITALARTHDLLVDAEWKGASIVTLVRDHLRAFGQEEIVSVSGPEITLQPNAVQNLGMAIHELGTNSAKYGALAHGRGDISLAWRIAPRLTGEAGFEFVWQESLLDAPDGAGSEAGFGTRVLTRVTPVALGGSASLERTGSCVKWVLEAPLAAITAAPVGVDLQSLGK